MIEGSETLTIVASMMMSAVPRPMKIIGVQCVFAAGAVVVPVTSVMAITVGPPGGPCSAWRAADQLVMRMPRHISSVVPSPQTM